jgi:hypothetical protein
MQILMNDAETVEKKLNDSHRKYEVNFALRII